MTRCSRRTHGAGEIHLAKVVDSEGDFEVAEAPTALQRARNKMQSKPTASPEPVTRRTTCPPGTLSVADLETSGNGPALHTASIIDVSPPTPLSMQPDFHFRLCSGTLRLGASGCPRAGKEHDDIGRTIPARAPAIGAGARDEPAQDAGISHFNESLLFRGTETRDARQLSETFDSLGASYDSSAGIEMTLMSAHLIGTKLLDVTDLLIDCARSSIMPQEAVDSVRTLIQQEIRQREDRPPQKVMDLARRTLFAGSPLGNDVLGTPETVNSIGRDDLVAYYHRYFHAGNVVISIAGNFAWDALLERLDALTDDWAVSRGRMSPRRCRRRGSPFWTSRSRCRRTSGSRFPACQQRTAGTSQQVSWPRCSGEEPVRGCILRSARSGDWRTPRRPASTA
jgi:hypothetical protein